MTRERRVCKYKVQFDVGVNRGDRRNNGAVALRGEGFFWMRTCFVSGARNFNPKGVVVPWCALGVSSGALICKQHFKISTRIYRGTKLWGTNFTLKTKFQL